MRSRLYNQCTVAAMLLFIVASVQSASICGDGLIEGYESCDDGNRINGDGCNSVCSIENPPPWVPNPTPWICITSLDTTPNSRCYKCGDGLVKVDKGEECDDKNIINTDGCGEICTVSPGYSCQYSSTLEKSVCALCGDGIINTEAGEICDAGSLQSFACNKCTSITPGYRCLNSLLSTIPINEQNCLQCGNLAVETLTSGTFTISEQCDDGGLTGGDGCSSTCQIEPNTRCGTYTEPGSPSRRTRCAICGNGVVETFSNTVIPALLAIAEECDDGNNVSGDGCSALCKRETPPPNYCTSVQPDNSAALLTGSLLPNGNVAEPRTVCHVCGNGVVEKGCSNISDEDCDGAGCPNTCRIECGNGVIEYKVVNGVRIYEECDDKNTNSGDGCSQCKVDHGYKCVNHAFPDSQGSACHLCGDGKKDPTEHCDDGNVFPGDGCSSTCTIETHGTCTGANGVLSHCIFCGNGKVESGEQCDDGNNQDGDGCDTTCKLEIPLENFVCSSGSPTLCVPCGNGVLDAGEYCDDGNHIDGDGCSKTCQAEEDSVFFDNVIETCGDGIIDGHEECDDSNDLDDDGCNARCQREPGVRINQSPCTESERTEEARECNDGNFENGDGCSVDCKIETSPDFKYVCTLDSYGEHTNCQKCGDGVIIPPETCDDGNFANGDGCSSYCHVEPSWDCDNLVPSTCFQCGNSVVEGSEECDDGNTNDRDGCSSSCKVTTAYGCDSELNCFRCGNGIVDHGEECDDANISSNDGCSATCRFEANYRCSVSTTSKSVCHLCGNGLVEGQEACDDGNNVNGDGCSMDCLAEYGYVVISDTHPSQLQKCGNQIVEYGEVCDGQVFCSPDCHSVLPGYVCESGTQPRVCSLCGDALHDVVVGHEECDDGNSANGDGCDSTCKLEQGNNWGCEDNLLGRTECSRCGDGNLDLRESCDDGNNANGDGCDSNCRIEQHWYRYAFALYRCGNGDVDHGEQCDDGNNVSNDGCSDKCVSETRSVCGDGIVDPLTETCDDKNTNDGDGCSHLCVLEPLSTCVYDPQLQHQVCYTCGDGDINPTEECDRAYAGNSPGSCSYTCKAEAGFQCSSTGCIPVDHSWSGQGTTCEGESLGCVGGVVQPNWRCLPGSPSVCYRCGDGILDITEDCDSTAVGCNQAECIIVNGYTCANPATGPTCSYCGNSIVDFGETCDDGSNTNGDGCDYNCHIEPNWYPDNTGVLRQCGNGIKEGDEECDVAPLGNDQACTLQCKINTYYNAICYNNVACYICGNGVVDPGETCDDGNAEDGDGCSKHCTVEYQHSCVPGSVPSRCGKCGDGRLLVGAEECDDGPENAQSGDGCSSDCKIELGWSCSSLFQDRSSCYRCGDGVVTLSNRQYGHVETCDSAGLGSGCSPSCQIEPHSKCAYDSNLFRSVCSVCGDGAVSTDPGIFEECDRGVLNGTPGAGCTTSCTLEPGFFCSSSGCFQCGNGAVESGETCDDGARLNGDGCSSRCLVENGYMCPQTGGACAPVTHPLCGNGHVDAGEVCDDGNNNNNDGCSSTCTVEQSYSCQVPVSGGVSVCSVCGDGYVQYPEECDDRNTDDGDLCSHECKDETSQLGAVTKSTRFPTTFSVCGNDKVEIVDGIAPEECDPRNTPACSLECKVSPGYECIIRPNGVSYCYELCGDGMVQGGETCDDGNKVNGDGCSSHCQVEQGWVRYGPEPNNYFSQCGDGIVAQEEQCDDGNDIPSDGCYRCVIDTHALYHCDPATGTASSPRSKCYVCGNGVVDPTEECDDGNTENDDGCNNKCQIDTRRPWNNFQGVLYLCGNGVVEPGEECDDGNDEIGDACSKCKITSQYCVALPDVPNPCGVCGDGIVSYGERCDDGNTVDGDGCSSQCLPETGFHCEGSSGNQEKSLCCPTSVSGSSCSGNGACKRKGQDQAAVCVCNIGSVGNSCGDVGSGNGVVDYNEQCDDGNTVSGDGCSSTGIVEFGFSCELFEGKSLCCASTSQCLTCSGNGSCLPPAPGSSSSQGTCQCPYPYLYSPIARQGTFYGNSCYLKSNCGNGVIDQPEACDDGNRIDGDGCSSSCQPEPGWACLRDETNGRPSDSLCCRVAGTGGVCGNNGKCSRNEQNTGYCKCNQGFFGDECTPVCGDSILASGSEACEDGNTDPGDGCSPTCQLEPGFNSGQCMINTDQFGRLINPDAPPTYCCPTSPLTPSSICSGQGGCIYDPLTKKGVCNCNAGFDQPACTGPIQGDGIVNGQEYCDDGNQRLETGGNTGAYCPNPPGDQTHCVGGYCPLDGCGRNGYGVQGFACVSRNTTIPYSPTNYQSICCPTSYLTPSLLCSGNGVCNPYEDAILQQSSAGEYTIVRCNSARTCTCYPGWTGDKCDQRLCGNGVVDSGEACDDNNYNSNDGCSNCQVESGWSCSVTPPSTTSQCVRTCGNGIKESNETCDDGNLTNNDGCSNFCLIETGYTCTVTPPSARSQCIRTCGDGVKEPSEECEDGNFINGDGCSAACTIEPGFICVDGAGCQRTCGNGVIDPGEDCEDGNFVSGDGCSNVCKFESGFNCDATSIPFVCCPTTVSGSMCSNHGTCGLGTVADYNEPKPITQIRFVRFENEVYDNGQPSYSKMDESCKRSDPSWSVATHEGIASSSPPLYIPPPPPGIFSGLQGDQMWVWPSSKALGTLGVYENNQYQNSPFYVQGTGCLSDPNNNIKYTARSMWYDCRTPSSPYCKRRVLLNIQGAPNIQGVPNTEGAQIGLFAEPSQLTPPANNLGDCNRSFIRSYTTDLPVGGNLPATSSPANSHSNFVLCAHKTKQVNKCTCDAGSVTTPGWRGASCSEQYTPDISCNLDVYDDSACSSSCGTGTFVRTYTSGSSGTGTPCPAPVTLYCQNLPECPPACGDGKKNQDSEQCDDGNTDNEDGCSATCQHEPGFTCNPDYIPGVCCQSACQGVCIERDVCACTSPRYGVLCENRYCEWSDWSDWSSCSVRCGGPGTRTRTRTIVNEAIGDEPCIPADATETENCDNGVCVCEYGDYDISGTCDTSPLTCGPGKIYGAQRSLLFGDPLTCTELTADIDCAVPCPTDCVLSDWGPCTPINGVTCGNGERTRTIVQEPRNGGLPCDILKEPCDLGNPCPQDCTVTDWSLCSASCGDGTRTRTVVYEQIGTGRPCPDLSEPCNNGPCPVDCRVTDFGDWSTCSASCGDGLRTRQRAIINNAAYGGIPCPALTESESCNLGACPVNCVVSDWSDWSTCSVSCGDGQQTRTRTVETPSANGGTACPVLTESRTCSTGVVCPVDCVVSPWSNWSQCSVTCGSGTQSRSRIIDIPAANGGQDCPVLSETRPCTVGSCQTCGNGIKEGSEVCDDGNTANGDGCNDICVKENQWWNCDPAGTPCNCSNNRACRHGTCRLGKCFCGRGWFGPSCSLKCLASDTCSGNGVCAQSGKCICNPGYFGPHCNRRCDAATCKGRCVGNGVCVCDGRSDGLRCDKQVSPYDSPCQVCATFGPTTPGWDVNTFKDLYQMGRKCAGRPVRISCEMDVYAASNLCELGSSVRTAGKGRGDALELTCQGTPKSQVVVVDNLFIPYSDSTDNNGRDRRRRSECRSAFRKYTDRKNIPFQPSRFDDFSDVELDVAECGLQGYSFGTSHDTDLIEDMCAVDVVYIFSNFYTLSPPLSVEQTECVVRIFYEAFGFLPSSVSGTSSPIHPFFVDAVRDLHVDKGNGKNRASGYYTSTKNLKSGQTKSHKFAEFVTSVAHKTYTFDTQKQNKQ